MARSTESSPLLEQSPSPPRLLDSSRSAASSKDSAKLVFSPTEQDKIPVWKKLTYAVGAMPYAMCNTVVGFYLNIFLLEVAILDPVYVLLIVFAGRVWDALTDPTIGFLCNRTRTPLGRLRPWLLGAMVPTGLAYIMLWFVPPSFTDTASYLKFIYYIIFYFAFQLLLTCIHVPYTSLTMHLSNSNKERDSATLYRMLFEVLGTLVGIGVYTAYFSGFVQGKKASCDGGVRERDIDLERTYRYHAVTLAILTVVFVTITLVTVREQKGMYSPKIGLFSGIRTVFTFRPYLLLFLTQLFGWLGITFVQGNYALYIKYALNMEDLYPYVIAVLLLAAIVWMPIWQVVMRKIGKKASLTAGLWIFMVTLLSLLFIDFAGDWGVFLAFLLSVIGGAGVAAGYLFPWSMLPDVIDEAYLKMGVRREELFYAFFVFGTKFSSGVTLGLSTGIYKAGGYDETKCDQPWTVPLTLKLLVTVPPIIFILIGLFCLYHYPISEESVERTRKQLELRRKTSSQNTLITAVSTQTKSTPYSPNHNGGVVTVTNNREPSDSIFTDTQVSETTFSSS
jgi:Na+/melibiose symporter-like transporter